MDICRFSVNIFLTEGAILQRTTVPSDVPNQPEIRVGKSFVNTF